ncbi:MAG: acyltransferase family protein [Sellimonas intestinalis]
MRKINQKEHYFYIDILRILACLCVIYMQCNRIADPYTDTSVYRQRMFVETIAYWAVPVFFMISGATLFDYRERYQTGAYFKKRFLKTGLPFITWTSDQSGNKGSFGTDGVSTKFVWYDRFVYQYNCGTGILVFHSAIYDVSLYTCSVFVKRLQADFGLYDSDGLFSLFCLSSVLYFFGNFIQWKYPVPGGGRIFTVCRF